MSNTLILTETLSLGSLPSFLCSAIRSEPVPFVCELVMLTPPLFFHFKALKLFSTEPYLSSPWEDEAFQPREVQVSKGHTLLILFPDEMARTHPNPHLSWQPHWQRRYEYCPEEEGYSPSTAWRCSEFTCIARGIAWIFAPALSSNPTKGLGLCSQLAGYSPWLPRRLQQGLSSKCLPT